MELWNGSWITFEGKEVFLHEIDHQHLSNVIWFNLVLYKRKHGCAIMELARRFGGKILPYRPHPGFKQELRYLQQKGYIHDGPNGFKYIIYDGNWVGYVWDEVVEFSNIIGGLPFKVDMLTSKSVLNEGDDVIFMDDKDYPFEHLNSAKAENLKLEDVYQVKNIITHQQNKYIQVQKSGYFHLITRFGRIMYVVDENIS